MSQHDEARASEPEPVRSREAQAPDPILVAPLETTSEEPDLPSLTTTPVVDEPAVETAITHPLKGEDFDFALPSTEVQLEIQEELSRLDIYPGRKNGRWGNLSVYGLGEFLGYRGDKPNAELATQIQLYAHEEDGFDLGNSAPGFLDAATWASFARALKKSSN